MDTVTCDLHLFYVLPSATLQPNLDLHIDVYSFNLFIKFLKLGIQHSYSVHITLAYETILIDIKYNFLW